MTINLNILENSKVKLIITIIFVMAWVIMYFTNGIEYSNFVCGTSCVLLIVFGVMLVLRAVLAKNAILLVAFAFMLLYTFPPSKYFFDGIYLSGYNLSYTYETLTSVNLIFLLFLILINFIVKITPSRNNVKIEFKSNDLIFYPLYVVSLGIVLTSKRSGNLYDGTADSVEVSSLNEYVIILFAILYLYSNSERIKMFLISALYLLYAFFTIISGGRVEIVLLILMLLSFRFQYTLQFKKILLLFIIGAWGLSIFGNIRHNPLSLLTGNLTEILLPFSNNNISIEQNSNEGDVYWASERMLHLMNDGEITTYERTEAAISFMLSSIVPGSFLPKTANLSNYKTNIYSTGGGGLAPVFFYTMFGYIGVIILAIFIANIFNTLSKNKISNYRFFYTMLVIISLPRWFAYYPIHIIKFCVYGVILYYITLSFDYTIKKYYIKK